MTVPRLLDTSQVREVQPFTAAATEPMLVSCSKVVISTGYKLHISFMSPCASLQALFFNVLLHTGFLLTIWIKS